MNLIIQVERDQAHGLVVKHIKAAWSWFDFFHRRRRKAVYATPGWGSVPLKLTTQSRIQLLSGDPLFQILCDADHLRVQAARDELECRV